MNFNVTFSSQTQVLEPAMTDLMYCPVPGESGLTPHIGENGNWWIGEEDTGVKAAVTVTTVDPTELIDSVAQLRKQLGDLPADRTVAQAIADARESATYDDTALSGAVSTLQGPVQQSGSAAHTAAQMTSAHNVSDAAHSDIRLLIQGLTNRLNTLANSDDTTLDQMAEVVACIKDNRDLIGQITTGKVSVSDIMDNLTTSVANKPLSANQGVALKKLIDALDTALNNKLDKQTGKGLSSNDYTTAEKQKLAGMEDGAQRNPAALKSPHPLTINGQSYDGSAPVSMDISGGAMPDFADSIEKMTNPEKAYVLTTDGYVYTYGEKTVITPPVDVFQNSGYELNKRHASSGLSSSAGSVVSGFIPVDLTKSTPYVMRIQGYAAEDGGNDRVGYYDENKTFISSSAKYLFLSPSSNVLKVTQEGEDWLVSLDVLATGASHPAKTAAKYIRVGLNVGNGTTITDSDVSGIQIFLEAEGGVTTESGWISTGMAYAPADYEDRIISLENTAVNHESRLEALESGSVSATAYPSFWEGAVSECISKIKALQVGRNCVTFPFFSDNHQRLGYAGALIRKVMEECHIPYCFYGGDSISSSYMETEAEMIEQDKKFDTMMKAVPNGRFCRTVGNHDGWWKTSANVTNTYTREQVYELFLREESISQLKHFGEDGTYYYVDDIASKTRFIVLNSNGGFGEVQRNWVQNTALQFNESGWAVVFVSHAPVTNNFHSNITDAQDMQAILTAYFNGSSVNKAAVVGWFSGHIHRDRIYQCDATGNTEADDQTTVTLPWKTVTITSDHTGIAYEDTTKHTVAEDTQSHAIDFVTVNRNTKTVHLTRLGIGRDRSYTY